MKEHPMRSRTRAAMRGRARAAVGVLLVAVALGATLGGSASAQTSCAVGSSSYGSAVAGTAGLVSYWRLGESSGSVACDSRGSSPGSYVGGVTLGQPGALAGDPATSVRLDGSSGYASVPEASSLDVGDRFSVEAWVKRGSVGGSSNQVVASKQSGSWVLMFDASNELVLRQSQVGDVAYSTVKVSDTTSWHHVVGTK